MRMDERRNEGEEKADGSGNLLHYTRFKRIIWAGAERGHEHALRHAKPTLTESPPLVDSSNLPLFI